ncbi:GAF domain-containing protein [Vibrio coralliilyticus]|uniref:GAF domain-containing protein n=1 Tax=Vibrio coralliilyticus TaxID=190893 RepID=UPI000BAAA746|nr:GAF domain-containing protein [Vibrio coralliilyticus]NOI58971.1 hypothetical protein [Vibrio coralliilyticus]PAT66746.1 hypothetical protein CKA27_18035 [Vibrio coralliilyticus]
MRNQNILSQKPFQSFEEASRFTLRYLHEKYGYGAWMMTRKNDNDWVILQIETSKYSIEEQTVLAWSDSMCCRMIEGAGPRWAPAVDHVESYVNAPIYQAQTIKSYVGIPICYPDGELFGTLCAIDTEASARVPFDGLATVELVAKLLSSLLQLELERNTLSSQQLSLLPEPLKDGETGFLNRVGWSLYLEKEQSNVRALGTPLYVIAIEAQSMLADKKRDRRSDLMLIRNLLSDCVANHGYLARLNESIFMVLLHDVLDDGFQAISQSLTSEFSAHGLDVQFGVKKHSYGEALDGTVMGAIRSTKVDL